MSRGPAVLMAALFLSAVIAMPCYAEKATPPTVNLPVSAEEAQLRQEIQSLVQQGEQLRAQIQKLEDQAKPLKDQMWTIHQKVRADRDKIDQLRGVHRDNLQKNQPQRKQSGLQNNPQSQPATPAQTGKI